MRNCEGILICSDFDGTFFNNVVPENNIKAVNEFMAAGGHFTFCTGRRGDYFKKLCSGFMPNVPIIGMGGGQIYDMAQDKSLKQVFFGEEIIQILRDFIREYHGVKTIRVDFIDHSEYFMPDDTVVLMDYWTKKYIGKADRTPLSRLTFEECPPIYKAVLYFDHINADVIPLQAEMICKNRCSPVSNGREFIEVMPLGFSKGTAALDLKKITGDKTLIGVGDFMGDISLLKAADIGYAVENALPEVKAAADRVTVSVNEGALDAIIKTLL